MTRKNQLFLNYFLISTYTDSYKGGKIALFCPFHSELSIILQKVFLLTYIIREVKRGVLICLICIISGFTVVNSVRAGFSTIDGRRQNDQQDLSGAVPLFRRLMEQERWDEAKHQFNILSKTTLSDYRNDTLLFSDLNYYLGAYLLITNKAEPAREKTLLALSLRESIGVRDNLYRKAMSNVGASYYNDGKYPEAVNIYKPLLDLLEQNPDEITSDDLTYYNNLASAYNELYQYENAISVASRGIEISKRLSQIPDRNDLIMLYNNMGISHSRRNDYTTALLYLNQAMDRASRNPSKNLHAYISAINSLVVNNEKLGNVEKALSISRDAYPLALESTREQSFYFISNYSRFLAEDGQIEKVEEILTAEKNRLRDISEPSSRFYHEMMVRYSNLTSRYLTDNNESLRYFETEAIPYISANPEDYSLARDIHHAFALALMKANRFSDALREIQLSLFPAAAEISSSFANPKPEEFIADRTSLGVLTDKINILHKIYSVSNDTLYLSHAISANKFLIASVEKVRIDISEEESRILLGDRYRVLYDGIITDMVRMYSITGNERYFNQAFEYAERSKASGLLVSLREVKASQFLIPDSLALKERELEREIGTIREQISVESAKGQPRQELLTAMRETEFSLSSEKAELINLFENKYPEYYAAKYNTDVASIEDVLSITGRNGNYINYISTDTVLYTFVINRKFREIISVPTGNSVNDSISRFRSTLQKPHIGSGARASFSDFVTLGNYLYNQVFRSAEKYLISDNLIISPDKMLTYIPFEALVKSPDVREDLLYRELPFLIKDYRISYTYSATMYVETSRSRRTFVNKVLAFAPNYNQDVDINSILNSRQADESILRDLPFAREEASYVTSKLGGELYLNDTAQETVFKKRAPSFSILHLAMHTVINEVSPGYSKLIFANPADTIDDGFLNTYEIYNIPLAADMVVVSSCNTGSGRLRSGEGVMSLARGFVNAGSRSVVMSLWEVNDEWGTEVMKSFYDNLLAGQSKSVALRNAKLMFIENDGADQFKGNPFYWATLVIYGNNEPIFWGWKRVTILSVLAISLLALAYSLRKRFYKRL